MNDAITIQRIKELQKKFVNDPIRQEFVRLIGCIYERAQTQGVISLGGDFSMKPLLSPETMKLEEELKRQLSEYGHKSYPELFDKNEE